MAAWRLWRSGGPDTDTAVVLPARAACGAAELRRFVAWWAKKEAASMAMMSSDDAAQQRTTRSPRLHAPPQGGMLGRRLEQIVRHDITDELNEEAAITNAQVQRAEQMCLARNAKNRAKREKKREKMLVATFDAKFMPDTRGEIPYV